ncbi:MAG: sugar isomerase, partial [Clostridia bacterium]|nr:sugar isomerase [Clostridia bacterium]
MENKGKKIKYNLILGIASEVLTIILGIIVPRLVLTNYGSEVNGLLGSVSQIYAYVALLEAGVGTATVQALYRTVSKNNRDETNAVLAATNRYYHRTGLLYLLAILLFSILYPLTVDTSIPLITIVLVIVFNGLGSVINYFFQAKYFLLLSAEGKNYIKNGLTMFTNVFKNIAKIVLIRAGFDVVFVQAIAMVVSLIQMVYVTWYIKKYYSWIDLTVEPDFASISQSKNVLVHQITGLVFNNTDNITLTYFAGL